jgi:hypothetical protein
VGLCQLEHFSVAGLLLLLLLFFFADGVEEDFADGLDFFDLLVDGSQVFPGLGAFADPGLEQAALELGVSAERLDLVGDFLDLELQGLLLFFELAVESRDARLRGVVDVGGLAGESRELEREVVDQPLVGLVLVVVDHGAPQAPLRQLLRRGLRRLVLRQSGAVLADEEVQAFVQLAQRVGAELVLVHQDVEVLRGPVFVVAQEPADLADRLGDLLDAVLLVFGAGEREVAGLVDGARVGETGKCGLLAVPVSFAVSVRVC